MTLPFRNSQGRLAFFVARLNLPLVCFLSPIPPTPLPLRGRGSPKDYFAGGFAPGTPALNRLRHLQTVPNRYPEAEPGHTGTGGESRTQRWACLLCRPPKPAFSVLSFPHPPYPPSPPGKGETLGYFYARGFAPCIPKAGRGTALAVPAVQVPRWGGAESLAGNAFCRFCGDL